MLDFKTGNNFMTVQKAKFQKNLLKTQFPLLKLCFKTSYEVNIRSVSR